MRVKKSAAIAVRCTPDERETLRLAAANLNLSIGGYIRSVALLAAENRLQAIVAQKAEEDAVPCAP